MPRVRVKYETLGGTVVRKVFDSWEDAQQFADRKEVQPGIQWVDVEEV